MWLLTEAEMGQRIHDMLLNISKKYGLPDDNPAINHWRQFTRTLGSAGSGFMSQQDYFTSYGEQAKALLDWLMHDAPEWIASHMTPERRAEKGIELPQAEAAPPQINHRVYRFREDEDTMQTEDYSIVPLTENGWLNSLGQKVQALLSEIAHKYGLPARDELETYSAYVLNKTNGQSVLTPAQFFEDHPDTTEKVVRWLLENGQDWIAQQDKKRKLPKRNGHI